MDVTKIVIYNKLNRIKPSNKSLKYPFNFWNPAKIKFTQKEIELKFKSPQNANQRIGGAPLKVTVF